MDLRIHSIKKVLEYGFLLWFFPFLVSVLIFPLHDYNRVFFESIMPVTITFFTLLFLVLYFKDIKSDFLNEGIIIGIAWFIISIIIDLFMFLPPSPMQMSIGDYFMDIGFTYIIIIVIPIAVGYTLEKSSVERRKSKEVE